MKTLFFYIYFLPLQSSNRKHLRSRDIFFCRCDSKTKLSSERQSMVTTDGGLIVRVVTLLQVTCQAVDGTVKSVRGQQEALWRGSAGALLGVSWFHVQSQIDHRCGGLSCYTVEINHLERRKQKLLASSCQQEDTCRQIENSSPCFVFKKKPPSFL